MRFHSPAFTVALISLCISPICVESAVTTAETPGATVEVPGGTFPMGCPGGDETALQSSALPRHEVTLSPFSVSRNLVTAADFAAFLNIGVIASQEALHGMRFRGYGASFERLRFEGNQASPGEGQENWPIHNVSWVGANAYCEWLSDEEHRYRLPTEAEWEYLATNAGTTRFPWGDAPDRIPWLGDGSVGSHPEFANQLGVQDLIGSMRQWCHDNYSPDFYSQSQSHDPLETRNDWAQPSHSPPGPRRVIRGGFNMPTPNPSLLESLGSGSILPRGYSRDRFREHGAPSEGFNAHGFRWVAESVVESE